MNGPLKFLTARKILPSLDLLAKFKRVLSCSCSPNFCSCSHARFPVSIKRKSKRPARTPNVVFVVVLHYQMPSSYIFVLTSMSFRDLPLLYKDMIGDLFKIVFSRG